MRRGTCDRNRAFTLIEVLVVVAIIGLLIAVLLPTLRLAREQSRATVCLSNLKQQGIGLSAYSADWKRLLPWAGSFRFSLMEGLYYVLGDKHPERHNWGRVNLGVLYPKYTGNTGMLFYCPGNRYVDVNGENGLKRLRHCHLHPSRGDPEYLDAHNFPLSPFGAYAYAVPAAPAASPRDNGAGMFPPDVVRGNPLLEGDVWPYWKYLNDSVDPDPSFLGPFPKRARGKHNLHALVSDGYFRRDYYGYHIRGHNVLFSDFHARRVTDPNGKIYNANLTAMRPWTYDTIQDAKVFQVWDYFSKNN
ncbi:MAG: prepilin-type N-terminal cleavage/methylation domain-containing protein [Planctomycetes bacterium]|nr:prepilin-type N-terminal cleavage/methylation domain-containing protein [Planctomycetota bacterium]